MALIVRIFRLCSYFKWERKLNSCQFLRKEYLPSLVFKMMQFIAENNTTEYNFNSTFSDAKLPGYIRITSMVFCVIILGIGVVGNVMVPIVILKTKDMRNSTNIFLLNLSVADLMVLLLCTPTVLVEVNSPPEVWILGEEMCKYHYFLLN